VECDILLVVAYAGTAIGLSHHVLCGCFLRLLWPGKDGVPFLEVLVADALCSVPKVLVDIVAVMGATAMRLAFVLSASTEPLATRGAGGWFAHEGQTPVQREISTSNIFRNADPSGSFAGSSRFKDAAAIFDKPALKLPFGVELAVLSFPFLVRARQCIWAYRCCSSPRERRAHFTNMCKYFSALPPLLVQEPSLWVFASVWSTAFALYWDVFMDWGVGSPLRNRGGKLIRSGWSFGALLLIAFDAVLRSQWAFAGPMRTLFDPELTKPLAELYEVERRVVWAAFRVEWEALKTVEAGKTAELPLRHTALRDL
jgi:hypothetical protein